MSWLSATIGNPRTCSGEGGKWWSPECWLSNQYLFSLSFLVTYLHYCGKITKSNYKTLSLNSCKQKTWVALLGKLFKGDRLIWEASEGALVPSSFCLGQRLNFWSCSDHLLTMDDFEHRCHGVRPAEWKDRMSGAPWWRYSCQSILTYLPPDLLCERKINLSFL